jgi:hypothetical protein
MKYWNEALPTWVQLQEKKRMAGVHRKMANVLWDNNIGDVEKAKEHYTEALKILEIEPKSIELASLYADMAWMNIWQIAEPAKTQNMRMSSYIYSLSAINFL